MRLIMNNIKRIQRKITNILGKFISKMKKKKNYDLRNKNFSIISCNCIGGMVYHKYSMKFLSPTINLFIPAVDFCKMVENLKYYFSLELVNANGSENYPIGRLGDVEIHFLHYKNFAEAKEMRIRRVKRVNFNNLVFIFTDRDGFNKCCLESFLNFNGKKVLFSHEKIDDPNIVFVKKDFNKKEVDDLTSFYKLTGKRIYEYYFDFDKWLLEGESTDKCRLNQ